MSLKRAARTHGLDARPHRLEGEVAEALARDGRLADDEHAGRVAVEAVLDARDVDVDDVAVLELLFTRNAVADHVVDRDAGGGGIRRHAFGLVAEAGGDALLDVDRVVVGELVEFARGDARLDEGRQVVEKFGGEAAGDAQARNLLRRFDVDGHDVRNLLLFNSAA